HPDPTRGLKRFFDIRLRTEDQEIDHITRIAGFVADAAGNSRKQGIIDAGHTLDVAHRNECGGLFRRINGNMKLVGSVARITARLIDSDGKLATRSRPHIDLYYA